MSNIFLKDRIILEYGFSVRVNNEKEGVYPVFGSNGITGYIDTYKVNGPGIVVGRKGTVGAVSYSKNNFTPTDTAYYVVLKDSEIDSMKFWYYYLPLIGLNKLNTHSSVPGLSREIAYFLKVSPPDISTQQEIASVLSSLDAKIELNNRINAELESMAKTLYDYWFVQFDFPDKNGKPYKSSGGKMVWNAELKREIPEGWEVGNLSDIANITMGQSPRGESYNENREGIIFFQGCTDFGNRFPSIRKYTNEPTRFAKEDDILLSVRAPVGTINIANKDCCIGRGLAALNSKDGCITYLWGVMMNLKQIFDRRNVDGTTFGSITKDDLFSLKVIKPTKNILNRYHSLINPAFHKQNKIELENIQLSELRDFLLPMLMNGQVKVQCH